MGEDIVPEETSIQRLHLHSMKCMHVFRMAGTMFRDVILNFGNLFEICVRLVSLPKHAYMKSVNLEILEMYGRSCKIRVLETPWTDSPFY